MVVQPDISFPSFIEIQCGSTEVTLSLQTQLYAVLCASADV